MVGGLSFCPVIIRSSLYHPNSYLIISGVCKTHPTQVDTDIPQAHAGCSLQWRLYLCGPFLFPGILSHSIIHWSALILIRSAAEQRTTRIRLNIHLWPTWSPSSLLRFLAVWKGDPVGFFTSPCAAFSKRLAVCLNSTLISDIELIFSIRNSKATLKSQPWSYP